MAEEYGTYVVVPRSLSPEDVADLCARLTEAFIKVATEQGIDLSKARIRPWDVEKRYGRKELGLSVGMAAVGIHTT